MPIRTGWHAWLDAGDSSLRNPNLALIAPSRELGRLAPTLGAPGVLDFGDVMTIRRNATLMAAVTAGVAGALVVAALSAMARPGAGPGRPAGQGQPTQQGEARGNEQGRGNDQGSGNDPAQGTVTIDVPATITPATSFTGTATVTMHTSVATAQPSASEPRRRYRPVPQGSSHGDGPGGRPPRRR